jgi:hypothetical protein
MAGMSTTNARYATIAPKAMKMEASVPKYHIDIEGNDHDWDRDTITVTELRELGGFAADQEMIEVDRQDNSERVLQNGETIDLKPGKGFAKKIGFKRG